MPRDPGVAKALTASCTLASEFRNRINAQKEKKTSVETSSEDFQRWRKLAVQCNKALASQERQLHNIKTEYEAKLQMMKAEMRSELIDREGNAARVMEKQRNAVETEYRLNRSQLSSFDNIKRSVAVVEATLQKLSCVALAGPSCSSAVSTSSAR